jgi:predicted ArsR family transcriptional regulator
MQTQTRQRIIDFLNKHTSSSAEEISNALYMTKENIQYHLKRLSSDGLIEIDTKRKSGEIIRGRPTIYYQLSASDYPSDILHLADCLLHQFSFQNALANNQQLRMSELAHFMFKPVESSNLSQTIQLAIKKLNEHNYQASWEARLSGPRIYFRNCPYAALLGDHPELCDLDRLILDALIRKSSCQIRRIGLRGECKQLCVFEFVGV